MSAVSLHKCYIQLLDPTTDAVLWRKEHISDEDYARVKDASKSREVIPIFLALIKPVRTDTWENLATDFFLPTLINHALKVEDTFRKYIAIVIAVVVDGATLIIRVFTVLPRIYSNSNEPEHFLKQYLKKEGVDPKLLESNFVRVKMSNGRGHTCFHVNFIELPIYEGYDHVTWSL